MLPFLAGERGPGWAGDVRATITGLGLNTTPLEILPGRAEVPGRPIWLIFELLTGADAERASEQTVIASGGCAA